MPKLVSVEVVSVHCNLINNNYQQVSKVLFTFVRNKQFGQLIIISPHSSYNAGYNKYIIFIF